MRAIAYARVLGPHKARVPSGEPVLLGSQPFDTDTISPETAIAKAAATALGIVQHEPNWKIIATYQVTEQATKRYHNRIHSRVYVLEYVPERAMRAHLGIDESVLDAFRTSWYLQRTDIKT